MSNYDELSRCKFAAFYYLGVKMLTEQELRKKLQKKEYSEKVIDETMQYLIECGYINDSTYAELYIKDAVNLKHHGISRIKRDLAQKGINRELLDNIIEDLEIDTSDALLDLVAKKAEKADLNDRKQRDRVIAYLVRRGYRFDEIFSAIRKYTENFEGEIED